MKSSTLALASLVALSSTQVLGKPACHQGSHKHRNFARHAMVKKSIPLGSRSLKLAPLMPRAVADASETADDEGSIVSNSSISTATLYNGTALYFHATGQAGACKEVNNDTDFVVGLPLLLYGDLATTSLLCGAEVFIEDLISGKNVTAVVADTSGNDYTTLSVAAFSALSPLDAGMLDVQYHFTNASIVTPSIGSPDVKVGAPAAQQVGESAPLADEPAPSAEEQATSPAPVAATPPAPAQKASTPSYDAAAAQAALNKATADRKAEEDAASARKAAADAAKAQEQKAASDKAAADAAWASSSKAAAAAATKAPAPPANNNNGGGQTFTGGFATYYLQNGNAGHCGTVAGEQDKVIALPSAMYANGAHCGKSIRLTRTDNGRSVVATVRDSCPSCVNNESLDLSVGAFTAIASESEGMVPISWQWA